MWRGQPRPSPSSSLAFCIRRTLCRHVTIGVPIVTIMSTQSPPNTQSPRPRPRPSHETSKAHRHGSHSFTMQRTPCLPVLRKRSPDGATTDCGHRHLIAAYYSFIDLERMKGWVNLVGQFTHISSHPLAVGRAQDRESSPVKDQRSTAVAYYATNLSNFGVAWR